ncbi:MAG TPA: type II toxin-antitoxin system death-on-curing family toxin [Ktedonobacterales bacterium]
MIRFLTDEIVQAIHDDQVRLYGGIYGLRDEGLLSSALSMPKARFAGQFLHASLFEMAAAYCFHLSHNQPFLDGNKRVAGMVMLTFLKLNGLEPIASDEEYYKAMMAVANKHMNKAELAVWLQTAVSGTPPDLE